MTTKVLIVDDHSVVRAGLEEFLELDQDIEVVGTASDGLEAIQKSQVLQPDVILMDLFMPHMDGIEATHHLKKVLPRTSVIMLTSILQKTSIAKAIEAGADGFLLKDINADELCQVVKSSKHRLNSFLIAPAAVEMLVKKQAQTEVSSDLSGREKEVLLLVAQGKANKEIAQRLHLSEGTVKTHVSIMLAKLGLQSRTQAALYAATAGLLPSTRPLAINFQ